MFLRFFWNLYNFFTPPRGRVRKSTHGPPFRKMSGTSQPPGPQFRSILVNPWDPKSAKIHTRPYGGLSGGLFNAVNRRRFTCLERLVLPVNVVDRPRERFALEMTPNGLASITSLAQRKSPRCLQRVCDLPLQTKVHRHKTRYYTDRSILQ
jgi:hypothetical protein